MAQAASPALSVVIPTCNRPEMVGRAIESALASGNVDVEVIVVDDCPSPATAAAVAAIAHPKLRYVANPTPSGLGPALARNHGLSLARGAIIHFLDDDDAVFEGAYEAAISAFAAAPEIGAVFGQVDVFGDDPALLPKEALFFRQAAIRARRRSWLGPKWGLLATMLFGQTVLVCGSGLVRRACAQAVGGFNPDITMFEDVEFYTRVIRRAGAYALPHGTLHYRIGPSLARQPGRDEMLVESFRMSHAAYAKAHGRAELIALKILNRGLEALNC